MRSARPLVIGMLLLLSLPAPTARAAAPAAAVVLAAPQAALVALLGQWMTMVSGGAPVETPPAWRGGPPVRAFDGTPALDVRLLAVRASETGAELRWALAAPAAEVTVYRRGNRGGWETLARVRPDGAREVEVRDTTVAVGERYAYVLGSGAGGGEAFGGEARVEIPGTFTLAARGLSRDQASGAVVVTFVLPEDGSTRVAVVDGGGRRVWTRTFVPAVAGPQTLRVESAEPLADGTYRVTLEQGPRLAMARLTLAR